MIKYRVFHDGKMWYPKDFDGDRSYKDSGYSFLLAPTGEIWDTIVDYTNVCSPFSCPNDHPATVMLCLDVKDRNGKEIYEHDIVVRRLWTGHVLEVGYLERRGHQVFIVNPEFKMGAKVWQYSEKCEVIGNKHENADLL